MKRRVREARGKTGPQAKSRARATYRSDVSVALLLSASESAAAPPSPIWFQDTLQQGEEGQGRSRRDRAACTKLGVRNLLERRHRAQRIRKLVTIPPDCELLNHNLIGVHLCRPERCLKRPPPERSSLHPTRRCQRRSTRPVPVPLFSRVARLRLRASVLSALRPGHDAPFDHTSRARDARRARQARQARQARSPRALAPRARPARLSASARLPALCRRSLQPPCARALLLLALRPVALRGALCRVSRRRLRASARAETRRAAHHGSPRAAGSPRVVQRAWLCACCAGLGGLGWW